MPLPARSLPADRTLRPRVLVAHEPRAYREALAAALAALRPEAEVRAVDPEALHRALAQAAPALVFCGELTAAVRAAPAWVVLYPDGAPLVETCVAGERATLADLGLEAALALLDRAAGLGPRCAPIESRQRA